MQYPRKLSFFFFPELGVGTANCAKQFKARKLYFFFTTAKSKKDPLAVYSQTSLRNGGNFTRRKEYLQEGHSCPGVLAGCQWNTLSVLDLGFKSTTGNLVWPLRRWSPPVKIPVIFFPADAKCIHDNGRETGWWGRWFVTQAVRSQRKT